MNPCKTCAHPSRKAIDEDLRRGEMSLNTIAEKHGASKSSLFRHKESGHHLQTETATETPFNANSPGIHEGYNAELRPQQSAGFSKDRSIFEPVTYGEQESEEVPADRVEYTNIGQIFPAGLPQHVKKDLARQAKERRLPMPRYSSRELTPVQGGGMIAQIDARDQIDWRRREADAAASVPLWAQKSAREKRRYLKTGGLRH
jgi:hypothetical protein